MEAPVEEQDLAGVIQAAVAAGKDTVYLKPASEVLYLVGEQGVNSLPKDVAVNLIGAKDTQNKPLSRVEMKYVDTSDVSAKYMVSFKPESKNISIEGIHFDLAQNGRGGLYFEHVNTIRIQNCQFGGYSYLRGHYREDSNIMLKGCQNVWIEDTLFLDNKGNNDDNELNRCVTIQESDPHSPISENIYIRRNQFSSVCQGVVLSTQRLTNFQAHQNTFERIGDNAFYALQLKRGTFTENRFFNLKDEAFVFSAPPKYLEKYGLDVLRDSVFNVIGNQLMNTAVKGIGINGPIGELAILGNQIQNNYDTPHNRPAVLSTRPNCDDQVTQLLLMAGNSCDIDTFAYENGELRGWDVFPLGHAQHIQIKENRFLVEGLLSFQKMFSFTGGMRATKKDETEAGYDPYHYVRSEPYAIDTLIFMRNIIDGREGGSPDAEAQLVSGQQSRFINKDQNPKENKWWNVDITTFVIGGPGFPGKPFQNVGEGNNGPDYTYRTYY